MFIMTRTYKKYKKKQEITILAGTVETTFLFRSFAHLGIIVFFWNTMIKYTEHIISEPDTTRAQEREIYTTNIRDFHK